MFPFLSVSLTEQLGRLISTCLHAFSWGFCSQLFQAVGRCHQSSGILCREVNSAHLLAEHRKWW